MQLPDHFNQFLRHIRPTDGQLDDLQRGHIALRDRLMQDESLKSIVTTTFLQGSYRRSTAIRPYGDHRPDVDIIVVTNLDALNPHNSPENVYERFKSFLTRHYSGKYRFQGRSIGIELSYVDLDLVITTAPSQMIQEMMRVAESLAKYDAIKAASVLAGGSSHDLLTERDTSLMNSAAARWKHEPLLIPDRKLKAWRRTHPLEQIRWTSEKNRRTNGHFIDVVKAVKWWKLVRQPEPEHPKGFPLERMVGECCPDNIRFIADGLTQTLESIANTFRVSAANGSTPNLLDYGVPEHNVLAKISGTDFRAFYHKAAAAAILARRALNADTAAESVKLWQELLGPKFC